MSGYIFLLSCGGDFNCYQTLPDEVVLHHTHRVVKVRENKMPRITAPICLLLFQCEFSSFLQILLLIKENDT